VSSVSRPLSRGINRTQRTKRVGLYNRVRVGRYELCLQSPSCCHCTSERSNLSSTHLFTVVSCCRAAYVLSFLLVSGRPRLLSIEIALTCTSDSRLASLAIGTLRHAAYKSDSVCLAQCCSLLWRRLRVERRPPRSLGRVLTSALSLSLRLRRQRSMEIVGWCWNILCCQRTCRAVATCTNVGRRCRCVWHCCQRCACVFNICRSISGRAWAVETASV